MERREKRVIEFRVIAGSLKGRKVTIPDLGVTRPPLTRLRKSIFDYLSPYLADARYLDLFSGTGSYMFEAVSRRVATATGIELEPELSKSINAEAKRMKVGDRLICRTGDVLASIEHLSQETSPYDIVMIAPPQYKKLIDQTLNLIKINPPVTPDGLILCQHDSIESINFDGFELVQKRKYGNTTFSVIKLQC